MSIAPEPVHDGAPSPEHPGGQAPPVLSRSRPLIGHLGELRKNPIKLFQRVRDELGEIGEINFAGNRVVMMMGEKAQEAFFRGSDEQLDQAAAYPFMTPIFGRGVVFDGTAEQRKQAIRNQSLTAKFMKGHAETISREVRRTIEKLGDEGEIDVLDFFAELTIYTSSACLIGKEFREELTPEYFKTFYELEKGTDAIAYVNANLPLPAFRARDRARRRLVELLTEVFERRREDPDASRELFDVLLTLKDKNGEARYPIDKITGMFISLMFAGHHTTSGTAAWTLIEMLKHPHVMKNVTSELDTIYSDGRDVSYQALREIPALEHSIQEALRLHPPLIILMRKVMFDFHYKGWTVPAGKLVGVSPAVSNRMPECFPDPDHYDPGRYEAGREEDKQIFAWIPFGAGRHRCVGSAFAMMQLKAIFSDLLRHYEFELTQPHDSYQNDHSKMVVQLRQPCRARYRRRQAVESASSPGVQTLKEPLPSGTFRVSVDSDLCQGHGVCMEEAPDVFRVDKPGSKVVVLCDTPSVSLRERVALAVEHCPTRALSIEDS
ncbi:MAG: cytochrome P450 [Deltaproteobacteria bacterium]|nr:cytochrome P450 [Deltaproteobacteria bacterium]